MAKRYVVTFKTGAVDNCVVSTFSSRVCERGTKGCDVHHPAPGPKVDE